MGATAASADTDSGADEVVTETVVASVSESSLLLLLSASHLSDGMLPCARPSETGADCTCTVVKS